jgi:hypothetical protein
MGSQQSCYSVKAIPFGSFMHSYFHILHALNIRVFRIRHYTHTFVCIKIHSIGILNGQLYRCSMPKNKLNQNCAKKKSDLQQQPFHPLVLNFVKHALTYLHCNKYDWLVCTEISKRKT